MPGLGRVFTAKIGAKGLWGWWVNDAYCFAVSLHDVYYCPWCGVKLENPNAPRFEEKTE
jgi:hypothetical protein